MDLRSTCIWMLLVLTLCVLILQTDCTSEQCIETYPSLNTTDLHYKGISSVRATVSCLSHPDVKIRLKKGSEMEKNGKIKIRFIGDCLRLEAEIRPSRCSLLDIDFTKEKIECSTGSPATGLSDTTSLTVTSTTKLPEDRTVGLSTIPSTVNSTTELHEGEEPVPVWKSVVRCSSLLGLPALLFALYCVLREDLLRLLEIFTHSKRM